MKITIYVKGRDIENLHNFLKDDEKRNIEWYNDRPRMGYYLMVTISYDDFIKLDDNETTNF